MKNTLNLSSFLLLITGLFFKANHWAGANALLLLAMVCLSLTIVLFTYKDNLATGMDTYLNVYLVACLLFWIVAATFKHFHWPGKTILNCLGYLSAFATPLLLLMHSKTIQISKQYFFSFLLLFLLVLGLFPNNPIAQFLGQGRDYTISEQAALTLDSLNAINN